MRRNCTAESAPRRTRIAESAPPNRRIRYIRRKRTAETARFYGRPKLHSQNETLGVSAESAPAETDLPKLIRRNWIRRNSLEGVFLHRKSKK